MVDREKVLSLLGHRFPDATPEQLAAAANGLVGLGEEWEELTGIDAEIQVHLSRPCGRVCALAEARRRDLRFRVFARRVDDEASSG